MLATSNQFLKGLNSDMHPLTTSQQEYTDALNATLITFNGNEQMLQNDMGNTKIQDSKTGNIMGLREGFIPVGVKEHGGIIYIASVNKDGVGEIGTIPSPVLKLSEKSSSMSLSPINLAENKTLYSDLIQVSNKLSPGERFCLQLHFGYDSNVNPNRIVEKKYYPTSSGDIVVVQNPLITTVDSDKCLNKGIYNIALYAFNDYHKYRLDSLEKQVQQYIKKDDTDSEIKDSDYWFLLYTDNHNDTECQISLDGLDISKMDINKLFKLFPGNINSGYLGIKIELETIEYFKLLRRKDGKRLPFTYQYSSTSSSGLLQTYYRTFFTGFEYKTKSGIRVNKIKVSVTNSDTNKNFDIYVNSSSGTKMIDGVFIDDSTVDTLKSISSNIEVDNYSSDLCKFLTLIDPNDNSIRYLTHKIYNPGESPEYSGYESTNDSSKIGGLFYIDLGTENNVWCQLTVEYYDQFDNLIDSNQTHFNPFVNDSLGEVFWQTFDCNWNNQQYNLDGNDTFNTSDLSTYLNAQDQLFADSLNELDDSNKESYVPYINPDIADEYKPIDIFKSRYTHVNYLLSHSVLKAYNGDDPLCFLTKGEYISDNTLYEASGKPAALVTSSSYNPKRHELLVNDKILRKGILYNKDYLYNNNSNFTIDVKIKRNLSSISFSSKWQGVLYYYPENESTLYTADYPALSYWPHKSQRDTTEVGITLGKVGFYGKDTITVNNEDSSTSNFSINSDIETTDILEWENRGSHIGVTDVWKAEHSYTIDNNLEQLIYDQEGLDALSEIKLNYNIFPYTNLIKEFNPTKDIIWGFNNLYAFGWATGESKLRLFPRYGYNLYVTYAVYIKGRDITNIPWKLASQISYKYNYINDGNEYSDLGGKNNKSHNLKKISVDYNNNFLCLSESLDNCILRGIFLKKTILLDSESQEKRTFTQTNQSACFYRDPSQEINTTEYINLNRGVYIFNVNYITTVVPYTLKFIDGDGNTYCVNTYGESPTVLYIPELMYLCDILCDEICYIYNMGVYKVIVDTPDLDNYLTPTSKNMFDTEYVLNTVETYSETESDGISSLYCINKVFNYIPGPIYAYQTNKILVTLNNQTSLKTLRYYLDTSNYYTASSGTNNSIISLLPSETIIRTKND